MRYENIPSVRAANAIDLGGASINLSKYKGKHVVIKAMAGFTLEAGYGREPTNASTVIFSGVVR